MTIQNPSVTFSKTADYSDNSVVIFVNKDKKYAPETSKVIKTSILDQVIKSQEFSGDLYSPLNLLAPKDSSANQVIALGIGDEKDLDHNKWQELGGSLGELVNTGTLIINPQTAAGDINEESLFNFIEGICLQNYTFDKYKSKKDEDSSSEQKKHLKIVVISNKVDSFTKKWEKSSHIISGVNLARDLINEPSNKLDTTNYMHKIKELESAGLKVEVLDEEQLKELGMNLLLSVGQGSAKPSYVVIMKWDGDKGNKTDLALVGKGVIFDTGGISIKPSFGMESMKGDMGGSAAVVGTMFSLAKRKAKVNVVGIVGIVENMPGSKAINPGDIVKSYSGKTVEIINTDAEGRLVLADILWYVQEKYSPKALVELSTLTGAILVALNTSYGGLFTNCDDFANELLKASHTSGDHLWRLPFKPEHLAKELKSEFADIKNSTNSRFVGLPFSASFLYEFIKKDATWAHLDIAGVSSNTSSYKVNSTFGTGFGVRLLNQLVDDKFN